MVLVCKQHALGIVNVEGSLSSVTQASTLNGKGGVAIAFRYYETAFCFITCQLAPRTERHKLRDANLAEIFGGLRLWGMEADIPLQFHHLFLLGDLNYRVTADYDYALALIEAQVSPLLDERGRCPVSNDCSPRLMGNTR